MGGRNSYWNHDQGSEKTALTGAQEVRGEIDEDDQPPPGIYTQGVTRVTSLKTREKTDRSRGRGHTAGNLVPSRRGGEGTTTSRGGRT